MRPLEIIERCRKLRNPLHLSRDGLMVAADHAPPENITEDIFRQKDMGSSYIALRIYCDISGNMSGDMDSLSSLSEEPDFNDMQYIRDGKVNPPGDVWISIVSFWGSFASPMTVDYYFEGVFDNNTLSGTVELTVCGGYDSLGCEGHSHIYRTVSPFSLTKQ